MALEMTVVVPLLTPRSEVEALLRSLRAERPALADVVLVYRAAEHVSAAYDALGARGVALPSGRAGVAALRNTGAFAAKTDVLAFLSPELVPRPGWAAALCQALEDGADVVAGEVLGAGPTGGPDLEARNGFLGYAVANNMAIRREVFTELGGFDESLGAHSDADLSFRAQLGGFRLAGAPATAVCTHPSPLPLRVARHVRDGRDLSQLEWKYQNYPLHRAFDQTYPHRAWLDVASCVAPAVRAAAEPSLRVAIRASAGIGRAQLLTGLRRPATELAHIIEYLPPPAAPPAPALLVIGSDERAVRRLAGALATDPDLAVAPPALAAEAVDRWDEPAPWSTRMARHARSSGWPIPVELAARRLETARPGSWGQSYLALHGVHAWLTGKPLPVVAVAGDAGSGLRKLLPDVPVVDVDVDVDGPDPDSLVDALTAVLGRPLAPGVRSVLDHGRRGRRA